MEIALRIDGLDKEVIKGQIEAAKKRLYVSSSNIKTEEEN